MLRVFFYILVKRHDTRISQKKKKIDAKQYTQTYLYNSIHL